MSELNKKLAEIQLGLHAAKDKQNSFGKYSYRSAEGIMQALKPLLGDASVILTDSIEHIGDRYYVKATATLTIDGLAIAADEVGPITLLPSQSISVSAFARECLSKKGMDDAQLTGSCSSYARKYALCGLFLIDDSEKEIDSMDNKTNPSLSQADLDANEFMGLFEKKDLAGISSLWGAIKLNKPRAAEVWGKLNDDIRKVISAAMEASK